MYGEGKELVHKTFHTTGIVTTLYHHGNDSDSDNETDDPLEVSEAGVEKAFEDIHESRCVVSRF